MKHINNNAKFNRFRAIDALRGIAALLVIFQHSSESFAKIPSIASNGIQFANIIQQYDFGRIGIICFFLISGFVIPASFDNNQRNPIKSFAIRRFFRLYPAYWLSIIAFVIYKLALGIAVDSNAILANATMLQSFFLHPHLIGLYWTLQIELIFYVLCTLLFSMNKLNNNRTLFAILTINFVIFVSIQTLQAFNFYNFNLSKEFQLMPYMLSIMFMGALLRALFDQKKPPKKLYLYVCYSSLLCIGLPLTLLLSSLLGYELINDSFRFGSAHCLGFILFFVGLKLLKNSHKIMIWLGAISYSLYLFHAEILQILVRFVTKQHNSMIDGLHLTFYMALTVIISIIVASLIYMWVEKPAMKLGKNLANDK